MWRSNENCWYAAAGSLQLATTVQKTAINQPAKSRIGEI